MSASGTNSCRGVSHRTHSTSPRRACPTFRILWTISASNALGMLWWCSSVSLVSTVVGSSLGVAERAVGQDHLDVADAAAARCSRAPVTRSSAYVPFRRIRPFRSSRDTTPHRRLIAAPRTLWFPKRVGGQLHAADAPPITLDRVIKESIDRGSSAVTGAPTTERSDDYFGISGGLFIGSTHSGHRVRRDRLAHLAQGGPP
jgi:hypothetical protein